MKITVIIPTHNRAALLDKTLFSLTLQNSHDFTVFVVDHGSDDDTRLLCEKYIQKLSLTYLWLAKGKDAPGVPRHFAMERVETPLTLFLDCGIMVPSFFISAHLAFHQQYQHHVGIGYFHGHVVTGEQDGRWPALLEQINLDDADAELQRQPDLADERKDVQLPAAFQWIHGWTGNLSLQTQDYWAVGGFDQELGYANEDIELSYRLLKHGVQFAIVENGWGIHLPHPRQTEKVRRRVQHLAWHHCYHKLRTLAVEIMLYAGLNTRVIQSSNARQSPRPSHIPLISRTFQHLSQIGHLAASLPSTKPLVARYQFPHPSLLIGGLAQDSDAYDYVTLADESKVSTSSVWSCCGIRIPLDDHTLKSVVVSDIWKWLNHHPEERMVSPLECMIADIRRTAPMAFFVDSPATVIPDRPASPPLSVSQLEELCAKYELPFQIIVPEAAPNPALHLTRTGEQQ